MNDSQIAILKTELNSDPLGKGYAGLLPNSPGTVADILNALTESMVKAIRTTTAQAWAAAGPYSNIVDAANNATHPARASCLMLRETLSSGVDIHVELPDVQIMLAGWVATGVITSTQKTDLMSRALQPASRGEVLGIGHVSIENIIKAQV